MSYSFMYYIEDLAPSDVMIYNNSTSQFASFKIEHFNKWCLGDPSKISWSSSDRSLKNLIHRRYTILKIYDTLEEIHGNALKDYPEYFI